MPDFSRRSEDVEIMDDLDCSGEVVHQTLRELEVINAWLGGNSVTLSGLDLLLKNYPRTNEIITIADLGCGGGDMLRLIDHWARKKNLKVKLIGIDANPNIIRFAEQNVVDTPNVTFLTLDIFSESFQQMQFDIVVGTLFYHHFNQDQLTAFFEKLKKNVRVGFVINDIHRHPLAYHSIRLLTKFFSRSAMVKFDAPLSVARAFTKNELQAIMRNAGLTYYRIRWRWAFRWQVVVPLFKKGQ